MSVIRRWRVSMVPRTTKASVTRVTPVGLASPPIPANTAQAYPAGSSRGHPISASAVSPRRGSGARGHQVLRAVLQPLVQGGHGLDRVDLVDGLVRAEPGD